MYINNLGKRIISVVLALLLLLSLSACNGAGNVVEVKGGATVVEVANPTEKYHSPVNYKCITNTGLYKMYVDETNFTFAIKDSSGQNWYGLPKTSNKTGSMLNIIVSNGKQTYKLNSQENSVAFGTANCSYKENEIVFSYVFSEKKDNPSIKIPVSLTLKLEDGLLSASVNCEKISENLDDLKITNIELLPSFGSVENASIGDFILIPDGSGALIDLATADSASYSIETYGADYAVEKSNSHSGIIGAFGIKSGNSAITAIVTNGAAISSINANTQKGGINSAYASFAVTPNSSKSEEDGTVTNVIGGKSYEGKISVNYRFLSGSTASYTGMASVCREQLVRDGLLSTRSVSNEGGIALPVTLVCSMKKTVAGTSLYTSFENAEDIASILKAKGINDLNLELEGAFSGGINQVALNNASFLKKMGKKSEFESLVSYMNTQGFGLYLSTNIITAYSGGKKASGVISKNIEITEKNPLKGYVGSENKSFYGLSSKELTNNVVEFMSKMKDYDIPGYSISDAGKYLFSDYSSKFVDRQAYADEIFDQVIALSTNKKLMVNNGNLYTLKNALIISGLPLETSYDETAYYSSVPFVQMILHGTAEYTGPFLNLSEDYNKTLLKCIEYGAIPSFQWTYINSLPKNEEKSKLYYDNWVADALTVYEKINVVFKDLKDAKMTGHEKIQEGLYRTSYNNETFIYVNYTSENIEYNNLTIKAGSYLRVN
ncbi:MAG: DUF5696 domain-containing protein [Oscillospiraceae bacterium]|nr:DUF5696 domain-containing protein [Oscillospiraceae bacterium]